jgi:hypothetical protein
MTSPANADVFEKTHWSDWLDDPIDLRWVDDFVEYFNESFDGMHIILIDDFFVVGDYVSIFQTISGKSDF